jgi:hypothetical protein
MLNCEHRRDVKARTAVHGLPVIVFGCTEYGSCTLEASPLKLAGTPLQACEGCPEFVAIRQGSGEPVGDALHELLSEIGITRSCSRCEAWRKRLNAWGVIGCQQHRHEILTYLQDQAQTTTWVEALSAAVRLYWSVESVLDEAIKRAIDAPRRPS